MIQAITLTEVGRFMIANRKLIDRPSYLVETLQYTHILTLWNRPETLLDAPSFTGHVRRMFSILLLKLFLPCLIYRYAGGPQMGAGVAGWLSAFPIVSGPILLTITLEQGPAFAATAAEDTLLAVVAILVFSVAYAWAAQRHAMAGAMLLRRGLRGILCQPVDAAAPAAASACLRCAFTRALLVQLGMKRMLSMSKTLAASKV
jgi:hypothetical protein